MCAEFCKYLPRFHLVYSHSELSRSEYNFSTNNTTQRTPTKMVPVFYDHDAIANETLPAFTSWMGSITLVTVIDSTKAKNQSKTDGWSQL